MNFVFSVNSKIYETLRLFKIIYKPVWMAYTFLTFTKEKNSSVFINIKDISTLILFKLRYPPFFLCLNTSLVFTNNQPRQCNMSYNRAFIVDWS